MCNEQWFISNTAVQLIYTDPVYATTYRWCATGTAQMIQIRNMSDITLYMYNDNTVKSCTRTVAAPN